VYLIHAADGFLPSDMSTGSQEEIEEELRLAYVALTRAKNFLYVTWPFRYYHKWYALSQSHSYAQLCRFFTPYVLETIDDEELLHPDETDSDAPVDIDVDVGERIRRMWEAGPG
ncbi:MAG: 3'-5' exonuclease, partial [Candidatus Bipolaricaulia bacterium]